MGVSWQDILSFDAEFKAAEVTPAGLRILRWFVDNIILH